MKKDERKYHVPIEEVERPWTEKPKEEPVSENENKEQQARIDRLNEIADWEAGYQRKPPPEKEGPVPPTVEAIDISWKSATGIRITPAKSLMMSKPKDSALLMWDWTIVPWYARLLGLLRLPYDLVKFVITGRLIAIPWPWRW
jgi:hypothetical protein